jgi:RHS repeat-associated protein
MQVSGMLANLAQPEMDFQSLPYGDGFSQLADQYADETYDDSSPLHFTGKERDTESGNDYFDARYYSNAMGRFMSPDWSAKEEPVPYAKVDDPQTLNLYAYMQNDPLGGVDPDGHTSELDAATARYTLRIGVRSLDQIATIQQQMNNDALAGEAANAQGSQHWAVKNHTKIAAGKDKCNEFVGDMIEGIGRARPRVKYTDIRGWLFGMTRDPSAKEWATANIPGYSAPMPVSSASKGDIIAVGQSNNGQGRVGI